MLIAAAAWVALMILSMLIDKWAFHHWSVLDPAQRALMESKDWYRLFRIVGFVPTWLVVGVIFILVDSGPGGGRGGWSARGVPLFARGPFLIASTLVSGLLAEIVKVLARRARPIDTDGAYAWVPWDRDIFKASDLGFPSSHAAVAFAAAFALARLHPRTIWIMLPAAALCGITRVWTGQHFLSDIVGAGVVGWLSVQILSRIMLPRTGR